MTEQIQPQPGIMDIELYVGGKGSAKGARNVVKLSSNENPLGASPSAREAFREQADLMAVYPSSDHNELRNAIADLHGLNADQIICGNGSDEVLMLLCQAFAGVGDEVMFTEHGFGLYRIYALATGATPVEVSEKNRTTDVDSLIEACTENTKLVFIANPNNPTGTFIPMDELERLADGIPETAVLVLDGAYAEFVEGYDGGVSLVNDRHNVVMTRTFSKVYGLGGLRIGWGYASNHINNILMRLRSPFNINRAALAAAEAAVKDKGYLEYCLNENAKWRAFLITELRKIDISCDDSFANFVLARFDSEEEADAANEALLQNGLIIRQVKGYNLPKCLRITVGKGEDCSRIINVLKQFKGQLT